MHEQFTWQSNRWKICITRAHEHNWLVLCLKSKERPLQRWDPPTYDTISPRQCEPSGSSCNGFAPPYSKVQTSSNGFKGEISNTACSNGSTKNELKTIHSNNTWWTEHSWKCVTKWTLHHSIVSSWMKWTQHHSIASPWANKGNMRVGPSLIVSGNRRNMLLLEGFCSLHDRWETSGQQLLPATH